MAEDTLGLPGGVALIAGRWDVKLMGSTSHTGRRERCTAGCYRKIELVFDQFNLDDNFFFGLLFSTCECYVEEGAYTSSRTLSTTNVSLTLVATSM